VHRRRVLLVNEADCCHRNGFDEIVLDEVWLDLRDPVFTDIPDDGGRCTPCVLVAVHAQCRRKFSYKPDSIAGPDAVPDRGLSLRSSDELRKNFHFRVAAVVNQVPSDTEECPCLESPEICQNLDSVRREGRRGATGGDLGGKCNDQYVDELFPIIIGGTHVDHLWSHARRVPGGMLGPGYAISKGPDTVEALVSFLPSFS